MLFYTGTHKHVNEIAFLLSSDIKLFWHEAFARIQFQLANAFSLSLSLFVTWFRISYLSNNLSCLNICCFDGFFFLFCFLILFFILTTNVSDSSVKLTWNTYAMHIYRAHISCVVDITFYLNWIDNKINEL